MLSFKDHCLKQSFPPLEHQHLHSVSQLQNILLHYGRIQQHYTYNVAINGQSESCLRPQPSLNSTLSSVSLHLISEEKLLEMWKERNILETLEYSSMTSIALIAGRQNSEKAFLPDQPIYKIQDLSLLSLSQYLGPREEFSPGSNFPYPVWGTLKRVRVGVPKCKTDLEKWGPLPADWDTSWECGALQDPAHLVCPLLENPVRS